MKYTVNFDNNSANVGIPKILTDEHLRIYTGEQLKVILFLHGQIGKYYDAEEISKVLKINADNVNDALLFWSTTGLIKADDTDEEQSPSDAEKSPRKFIPSQKSPDKKENNSDNDEGINNIPVKPTQSEIAERIEESPEIKLLFNEAQIKLGKTPGYSGQCSLLFLHDYYGLPVEVIFMLLEYCVKIGKTNFQYIEAVGKDWGTKEIDTLEKAAAKISELENTNSFWIEFSKYTGIKNPRPTKSQSDYLTKWLSEMKFSKEAILSAYDEAAERTGKISFSYMDKILIGIFEKSSNDGGTNSHKKNKSGSDASYDIEKLKKESLKHIKYERKGKK